VLDENLAARRVFRWMVPGQTVDGERGGHGAPVHAGIDVAGAGDLELFEALDGPEAGNDLVGDLARRLAQLARQFEGQRQGVLTQVDLGRLLDDDFGNLEIIGALEVSTNGGS